MSCSGMFHFSRFTSYSAAVCSPVDTETDILTSVHVPHLMGDFSFIQKNFPNNPVIVLVGMCPSLATDLRDISHLLMCLLNVGAQINQHDVMVPDSRWQYTILKTQCFAFRLPHADHIPETSKTHSACSLAS